jgi:ketosteroid isomerase-like protein
MSRAAIARAMYTAFAAKDAPATEALLGPDFSFTSPLDNALDRDAFFRICWPGSASIAAFEIVGLAEDGERVFVSYLARPADGSAFRNTEILTIPDDQITQVEVFFGWSVPHPVPEGEHRDPS